MNPKPLIICAVVVVLASVSPLGLRVANAVPILQLYLEGATYDSTTESWVLAPQGSSSGAPFRLWAIGNVAGPGGAGEILDVRLSVAYDEQFFPDLSVTITPSQAGGLGVGLFQDIADPSVSPEPEKNILIDMSLNGELLEDVDTTSTGGVVTNGGIPVLSSGKVLPSHGEFGPSTVWQEYSLGDFGEMNSHIGDFIGVVPTELFPNAGQINAYDISVIDGSGATVHFDLYNHIASNNKAKFAPFSHDASIAPEPSSIVVWSLFCALGIAVQRWRRRKVS